MRHAQLSHANLTHANLARSDLRGATLIGTVLAGAYMFRTRVEGVDLSRTLGLGPEQLEAACGDSTTALPAGLAAPNSWPCEIM